MEVHSACCDVTNGFATVSQQCTFAFIAHYLLFLVFAFVRGVADWACVDYAGKGPVDNLIDHLANPAAINFTTNGVSLPGIPYMQP